MSTLASLGLGDDVQKTEPDTLGGYTTLASGVYPVKLGLCHVGKSQGGATSVTIVYKKDEDEFNETIYISSKTGSATYTDKRTGKKHPLPGWAMVNAICELATGKPVNEQRTEPRTIKLWNSVAQKQIPTEVECLIDLLDKDIVLGILRVIDNKRKLVGKEYVPTVETRTFNEISLVLNTRGQTLNELTTGVTEKADLFVGKWNDRFSGKDQNRSKEVTGSSTPSTIPPPPAISFD